MARQSLRKFVIGVVEQAAEHIEDHAADQDSRAAGHAEDAARARLRQLGHNLLGVFGNEASFAKADEHGSMAEEHERDAAGSQLAGATMHLLSRVMHGLVDTANGYDSRDVLSQDRPDLPELEAPGAED